MNREVRARIQKATQAARALLEREFAEQLEGVFDIHLDGGIAAEPGSHLDSEQRVLRRKLVAAIEHQKSSGLNSADAVESYRREAAFTMLNRFVALKMLEERGLVQECVSRADQSAGFKEFTGLAPGLAQSPDHGYRLYIESTFDEIGTEVRVLFDRRDPAGLLWPRRQAFLDLLAILNAADLAGVWKEDETIGWVYQYFNGDDERRRMRAESQAPRNSREMAVRNQFFTPRYVVEFLVDNTLGRIWLEMHGPQSSLSGRCRYFVRTEETGSRPPKDPRKLRILDPACGSGHFLLYCFDLLLTIYEEAWAAGDVVPKNLTTGRTMREDYPDLALLRRATPALILENNLHGVDIDPRAAQIAALSLWLRAQRAWNDFGIPMTERPPVRHTHVVIAEPMPGDSALVEEFASRLHPPLLRELFRKMVDEMKFAGELGTLTPVAEGIARELGKAREEFIKQRRTTGLLPGFEPLQRELDLSGIDDDRFFHEAEILIVEALRKFAETAANGVSLRRRLFAGDAAQGVALIDLLRKKFDVVLMNPPFGAVSPAGKSKYEAAYPRTKNDLLSAFVERGIQLLHPRGLLGAITSRTGFFLSSFQKWREEILLKEAMPIVFADLGYGIMDAAMVEAAAYCLEKGSSGAGKNAVFFRALEAENKAQSLLEGICDTADTGARKRFEADPRSFAVIPRSPFAYWAGDKLRSAFKDLPALESEGRTAKQGLATADDFRFLRAWWAVPASLTGSCWFPFAKGGEYSPFYADIHLVVKWFDTGKEIIAWGRGRPQNLEHFGRPGLTWPRRTQGGLSVRAMSQSCIFADKGPAAFVENNGKAELLPLLAILNSRAFRSLVDLQMAFGSWEVGVIQRTPIPHLQSHEQTTLANLAARAWLLKRKLDTRDEVSHAFALPALLQVQGDSLIDRTDAWARHVSAIEAELERISADIDDRCFELYGIDRSSGLGSSEFGVRASEEFDGDEEASATPNSELPTLNSELVSWAAGVAFGRFDVRLATGARELPSEPEPFDPLPVCSPGMLMGEDGPPRSQPPAGYPLAFPETGVLVDDPGHPQDLAAALRAVFNLVFGDSSDEWWSDISAALDSGSHDLRTWLRDGYFEHHLKRYSKSRRKAPIFWQLGIESRRYSLWLYAHRLTSDSFFRILNDFVTPKLSHEEKQLEGMVRDSNDIPSPSQRKTFAEQESFVEELRAFRDEIARIAPLWNPDLNDGVIINFAPLWRLVPQHKAWQKECKACWDKLVAGDYDWSHLAMHLWPERVVPKCADDRSLAITHGLEETFWIEGDDGKWEKRNVSEAAMEQLLAERTSPAVKAALKSLLEAPATGNGRSGSNHRKRQKSREARK